MVFLVPQPHLLLHLLHMDPSTLFCSGSRGAGAHLQAGYTLDRFFVTSLSFDMICTIENRWFQITWQLSYNRCVPKGTTSRGWWSFEYSFNLSNLRDLFSFSRQQITLTTLFQHNNTLTLLLCQVQQKRIAIRVEDFFWFTEAALHLTSTQNKRPGAAGLFFCTFWSLHQFSKPLLSVVFFAVSYNDIYHIRYWLLQFLSSAGQPQLDIMAVIIFVPIIASGVLPCCFGLGGKKRKIASLSSTFI